MRILFAAAAVAGLALTLAGCATITRGTTSQVQIQSEPPGALAQTSTGFSCTTPCTITVPRKDEFSVVFSKPGYRDETVDVKTQIAGAGAAGFAGNVILGGIIGMGADAATGATLEHVPNPVSVTLVPAQRPSAPAKPKRTRPEGPPSS
jgi:PEGA domain